MKNTQNVLIVALVVSAVLLTGVLVASWTGTSREAKAGSEFARFWGMVGTVGQVANGSDALYIIDVDQRRLNAYIINSQTGTIDIVSSEDLVQAFR